MAAKHPHFIQQATAHAHGQFAAKARAAGMSTEAFAQAHEHSPGKLGEEARLALELMHFARHGEARPASTPPLHDRVFPEHK